MTIFLWVVTALVAFGIVSMLAFIIGGLKNPASVFKTGEISRKRVLREGGVTLVFLLILLPFVIPDAEKSEAEKAFDDAVNAATDDEFKYADITLDMMGKQDRQKRHEIIAEFAMVNEVPAGAEEDFYRCYSEYGYTKSGELMLGEVMGWCLSDYQQDPESLSKRVNFDNFYSQFSGWDGSHYKLEEYIKSNMHDDESYEHIETRYRVELGGSSRAIVTTQFKGKNGFGAVVKQRLMAAVDVETGSVLEVIEFE